MRHVLEDGAFSLELSLRVDRVVRPKFLADGEFN